MANCARACLFGGLNHRNPPGSPWATVYPNLHEGYHEIFGDGYSQCLRNNGESRDFARGLSELSFVAQNIAIRRRTGMTSRGQVTAGRRSQNHTAEYPNKAINGHRRALV